ncbi:MAG: hypothetical protein IJJ91_07915, partial [Synergistaceae bacterium]|nr:hypothetical protein [Synergistaceae bacterium]
KTRSLLPNADAIPETVPNEQAFMESLERYKPYRRVYLWLAEKFASQSTTYRRGIPDIPVNEEREIIIDGSGAYILGKTWKDIQSRYTEVVSRRESLTEAGAKADWDGFAEDDQKQIEARVAEIEALLAMSETLSLREISGSNLVVTLLAVLELCRMGKARIEQDELFADVRISPKG